MSPQHTSLGIFLFLLLPFCVYADETYIFNTYFIPEEQPLTAATWETTLHPRINTFTIREDGSAFGRTETGLLFTQEYVSNTLGVRIQRFTIADHTHFIIDGEVVDTLTDFSSELAHAYETSAV